MRPRALIVATALVASVARAQPPAVERLGALAASGDSAGLAVEVRNRPADAQALLRKLIEEAGRSRSRADSLLRVAHRVAVTFASVWNDSFPIASVRRFELLGLEQRSRKISADSIRAAGNAALDRKGVNAAIALWREAARRSLAVPDTAGVAASVGNIGAGFYRASELDSAEAYLIRARELADAIGDRRTSLNALGVLGSVASDRGDLRRAQEIYLLALKLRTAIGDVRGAAGDHNNLGLIAADLGDLAGARGHYGEALALARLHKLEDPAATALLNLANAASVDGEYAEALARYRESLALFRTLGDDASSALVLHNLGLLALRRGEYGEARARLRDALGSFARVGTVEDLVQVRRDLASVDAATGDLRSAIDHLRTAETLLARSPGQHELAAGVALARADVASQLNTFAEADRQFARAQALYRRAGNALGEAEARQGQAMLLVERRQHARALEQLDAVLRIQLATGDQRPAALTRLSIGRAQEQRGDIAPARRALQEALDTLGSLGDAVGEATALAALGDLELAAGAPLAAEGHYRRGLARVQGRNVPTLSWQLHAGLGRSLRDRGATADASIELRAAIADVERMAGAVPLAERRAAFLADKWEPYADLVLLERARGNAPAAFEASERMRGRQMLDVLSRGRVSRTATVDSGLATREQDLRLRISELTQRLENEEGGASTLRGPDLSGGSSGVTREALARAQGEYAQLLLELRDDGTGLGALTRGAPTPWRAVAGRLARTQALLTYLVTDSTTLVFVLTADTVRVLDLNVARGPLTSLVDFARGTLTRSAAPANAAPAWRAPLRRLHQHLIAPLEDAGLLAGVRQLVIVPNGELHYLPFAALIRSAGRDEFLVERYDIGYAPSASAWAQLGDRASRLNASGKQPDAAQRVLALAPRSAALPGSREEVEAIRRLYGSNATVLTDGAASEQALRAMADRYGILHLATFGVLNQHNPLFSFVDLSRGGGGDGRLEVHEVFALALRARLVVLSACQTALASGAISDVPAGDDWVGLVRAFLGAGAQNVIATLWAVEDRSTARVMERLHKRLRAGESEIAALSEAQRETLRNPATSGPFYWAGFVLVGGQ